ncbi:hypothetical protein GOHSU_14_01580 [Gordonia hirsuta DSM 44140 = NBRC 16056]|uniref:Lipoprotein n=1 Tax=Gordonia hirsuta DSM 44140 = NBRC 16056 TaxID=1121927 RepID=L7L8E2_9ACTN|nr:hypothetical protein [Gordonia hirsuta]GAC56991.1 hypothetical protein GOHSU_14_01580 [Gordonia hirsuta DSM 44140 = NBRC 16056]
MRSFGRVLFVLFVTVFVLVTLGACGSEEDTGALPKDFPVAQVPLIDGAIQSADGGGTQWQVTVQAPATEANAFEEAVTLLTGAGYTEASRSETGTEKSVVLSKTDDGTTYWVTVGISASASAARTTLLYLVTAD